MLEELAGSHLLIVPLDRKGDWFRFHGLLGTALRRSCEGPSLSSSPISTDAPAPGSCEHEDPDRAVEHTIAAGDVERRGRSDLRR